MSNYAPGPMFAVLYIPNFSLQAVLRHEPELRETPVALLESSSGKTAAVAQLTDAAAIRGIVPGMTSTQARARCKEVIFRVRSEARENTAQEVLIECAYASAAYIESTAPGVCTLDLRGLSVAKEPPGGLEGWAGRLLARVAGFGLRGQVGVAAAPGLALQAARVAAPFVWVRDPREFWANLPVESLAPAPELLEVLRRWGIRSAGAFLGLGKDNVAERLGAAGVRLFEQAKADAARPLRLTAPKPEYQETFEFEQPIETLEPLLFIARRLLEELARRVGQAGGSIEELALSLLLESGQSHDRVLKIPAPTREVDVLFRILHNYLETARTESAVAAFSLRAKPCPSESRQFQLFETAVRDPNRFYETIGRISALLGAERVGVPVNKESHRPDDFRLEPVRVIPPPDEPSRTPRPRAKRGLCLRRFRPPLPVRVELRDGQPIRVEGNRVNAVISTSRGPWRVSGDWWEKPWFREEWDVQTKSGVLYRVFHDGARWFIDGAYD